MVYCNNEIGPESTAVLLRLLSGLEELQLSRIRTSHVLKYQHLRDITEALLEFGGQLKVFKLSHISLNDAAIAKNMCQFLEQSTNLTSLDLSWTWLPPKYLRDILTVLAERAQDSIRHLNLSYNSLTVEPTDASLNAQPLEESIQISCEFVEQVLILLRKSQHLNHLDLSGMNLGEQYMIKIINCALLENQSLISLHLSDNNYLHH